jgi:hypothetical protein
VIQHIGYVVEDLPAATEQFAREVGAGPFHTLEHIAFDEVTYEGGPAVYDHSSAFAAWGPIIVELTQLHDAQPAGLREALITPGAGVGHVGFLVDDQAAVVARLEALGMHVFHTGRTGPVSAAWLSGGPFGHPVEVLQRVPELDAFYASLR